MPTRAQEEEIFLGIGTGRLRVGSHAALLCWTAEELRRSLVAAVAEGLRSADRIVYVEHERPQLSLECALAAAGINPASHMAGGNLSLVTANEVLFRGGVFDPDAALARLRALVASPGAPRRRTRLIVEMAYLLADVPGIERATALEARLGEAFRGLPVVRICAFDAGREISCRVADALRMYPTTLCEGGAIRNPYYRAWNELRTRLRASPLARAVQRGDMTAALAPAMGTEASVRLAFMEHLLAVDDAATAAQHAVDWLDRRLAVGPVLCAGVDRARGLLVGLAGSGLAGARTRSLSASLDDRDDFLAAVLAGERPVLLGQRTGVQSTSHLRSPFRGASLMAFPMRALRSTGEPLESVGLLLTPILAAGAIEDARWVAATLARQLLRLGVTRRSEAPSLAREDREQTRDREQRAQFLSCMSHEMRTPLNAVLGYTSMLLRGMAGTLTADQERMLVRVDDNGRRLLSLINDVLDIARLEADRMPLTCTEFHVPELLGELLRELDPLIVESGLSVYVDPDPGLPPLHNDRHKTKQILLSLVVNALKFTPEGTVRLGGAFDASRRCFRISVADTGIGISAEDQAGLFADFGLPSQASPASGAGLGLSIALRLARLMGGTIALASEPGRGSTFTLEIGNAKPSGTFVREAAG